MKSFSSFFSRALSVLVLTLAATLFNIEFASAQTKPWLTENKTLESPQYACILPGSPAKELEWEADIDPGCSGTTVSYQWYAIVGGTTYALQDTASRITGTNLTTLTMQLSYLNNYPVHQIFCIALSSGGTCPGETLSSDTVNLVTVSNRPTINFTSITNPICEEEVVRLETAVTGPAFPKGELKYNWYVINDPAAPAATAPSGNVKTKNFSLDTTSFFTYTPDLNNDQDSIYVIVENVCGLDTNGTTLTVDPKPEVAIPGGNQTIFTCIDDSIEFVYNITNAVTDPSSGSTDVNWTIYVSGQNADDTTLINEFPLSAISGTGNTNVSFKVAAWDLGAGAAGIYTITIDSIANTTDGCIRTVTSNNVFNITVYPQPMVQFTTDSIGVCAGIGGSFNIAVDSATFDGNNVSWSFNVTEQSANVNTTCNLSNAANANIVPSIVSGSGNRLGGSLLTYNVPNNLVPGVYRYIITAVNSTTNTGFCSPEGTVGPIDTIEIHVFPRKTVSFTPTAQTICEDAQGSVTANFSTTSSQYCPDINSSVTDASFDFYFNEGSPSIDWLPASPMSLVSGDADSTGATNNATALAPGVYTLTADSVVNTTADQGGCAFVPSGVTYTLTVQPKPTAAWVGPDTVEVCQGTTANFSVSVTNATFGPNNANWRLNLRERGGHTGTTGPGANCTDGANPNTISAIINLSPSGAGNSSINYTVPANTLPGLYYYIIDSVYNTSPQNCGGQDVQDTIWIRVNPIPTVSLNPVTARVCELDSSPMTIVVSNRQQCTSLGAAASDVNWQYWYTDNTNSTQLSTLYPSPVGPPNNSITAYTNPTLTKGTYWVYIDSLKNTTHGCATAERPDSALFVVDPRPEVEFDQDTVDVCEGTAGTFSITVSNAYLAQYDSNWTVSYIENAALQSANCVVNSGANANMMGGTLNGLTGYMEITGDSDRTVTFNVPNTLAPGIYSYVLKDVTNDDGPCTGFVLSDDTIYIRVVPSVEITVNSVTPVLTSTSGSSNLYVSASGDTVCQSSTVTADYSVTSAEFCQYPGNLADQVYQLNYIDQGDITNISTILPAGASTSSASPYGFNDVVGRTGDMTGNQNFTLTFDATGIEPFDNFTFILSADTAAYPSANCSSAGSGADVYSTTYVFGTRPEPRISFSDSFLTVCEGTNNTSFTIDVDSANYSNFGTAVERAFQFTYTENSGNIASAPACQPNTVTQNILGFSSNTGSATGDTSWTINIDATSLTPGIYRYILSTINNTDDVCSGEILASHDTITIAVRPEVHYEVLDDSAAVCEGDQYEFDIRVFNASVCDSLSGIGATGSEEWDLYYNTNADADISALDPNKYSDNGNTTFSVTLNNNGLLAPGIYKFYTDSLANTSSPVTCWDRSMDSMVLSILPEPTVEFDQPFIEVCEGEADSVSFTVSNAVFNNTNVDWTVYYKLTDSASAANSCNNAASLNTLTVSGNGNGTTQILLPASIYNTPGIYTYTLDSIRNDDGIFGTCGAGGASLPGNTSVTIYVYPKPQISFTPTADEICENEVTTFEIAVTNTAYCPTVGSTVNVGWTIRGFDTTNSTLSTGTVINTSSISNPYTANVGTALTAGPAGTYFIRIDSMVNSIHGCVDRTIAERYDLKIDSLPVVQLTGYPAEVCEDSTVTLTFDVSRVRPGDNWEFTYSISGANTHGPVTVSGTGGQTGVTSTIPVGTLSNSGVNNVTFTPIDNTTTRPGAGCEADTSMSAITIQTLAHPDVTAFAPTATPNICSGEDNDYNITITNSAGKAWRVGYTITADPGMGSSFTHTDTFTGIGNGTFTRAIDVQNYASTFTDGTHEERTITLNFIEWVTATPNCPNTFLTDNEADVTVRPLPRVVLDVPDSACATSQATISFEVFNVLAGETYDFDWNTTNPTDGPNNISNTAGAGPGGNQGPTASGTFTTDPLFPTGYSDVFLTDVENTTTGCEEVSPWEDSIRVDPASFVGQITPPYTVCSNNPDVDTIRVINNVGDVIKYQSKPLAWGVWSDLTLSSEGITSIVLGDTSYFTFQYKNVEHTYRAIVQSGACPADTTDFSDYVSIQVNDKSTFAMLSYDSTICAGDVVDVNFALTQEPNTSTWRVKYTINGSSAYWTRASSSESIANVKRTIAGLSAGTYNLSIDSIYNLNTGCDTAVGQNFTIRVAGKPVAGSLSFDPNVCSGDAATVTWVPGTGAVKYWQTSTNGGATWANSTNIANSITITNITDTTWVRAIIENAPCSDTVNSPIGIIIPNNSNTSGARAFFTRQDTVGTYCADANGTLTLNVTVINAAGRSWTVYWLDKNKLDSFSGSNNTNFNITTKTGHMTEDFDISLTRIKVTTGTATCSRALMNDALYQVNIIEQMTATISSVPQELCQGSTVTFAVNVNGLNATDSFELSYNIGSVTETYRNAGDGNFTITSTATVNAPSSPSGNVAVTLNSITNISAQTSALTNCTYNLGANRNILVYAPTVGGTATGTATVCNGDNSGTVSVSGHVGEVLYWEYNDGGNWTQINSSDSTAYDYSDLTKTTRYRAVVKNGLCGTQTSSEVTITIQPLPTVTITNSKPWFVCDGDDAEIEVEVNNLVNPANADWTLYLTLESITNISVTGSGSTGSFIIGSVDIDDIDVEIDSIRVTGGDNPQCFNPNLTESIIIRMYENPKATITSLDDELCDGERAEVTFNVSNVGTSDNWTLYYTLENNTQASWNGTGAGNFTRTTSGAVSYTTTGTPWSIYRDFTLDSIVNTSTGRSSNGQPCSSLNLDADSIEVHAPTIAGTASGNATVCDGANSGTITLSNNVGDVLYWEYSTNNGASWTRINSSAADSVNYNNLTVTTQYRAVVLNGTCDEETSNDVTITIQPLPIATITNSKPWTICSGDDVTINFNVSNLVNTANAQWTLNYTVDGVDSTVSGSGDKGSLTLNNVTVDDTDVEFVSIVVTGGDNPQCTNNNLTDKITINVIENPEASFTSVPAELCDGETATVTFSVNNVGSTDNWEVYYTMEGTQARWNGTGPGTFTRTTAMAVAYTATTTPWSTFETITLDSIVNRSSGTSSGHGPCYSLNLDTDSIEVHAPTIAGTASGNATVCDGANSGTITLSNNVGDVLYWEYSTNNGASWTRINSSAADSVNYNNITVTTQYRAVVLNGTCDEKTSNPVTITIQPLPIATITNSKPWTICSGDDVTINFNVTNLVNTANAQWTLNYTVDGVDSTVSGSGDKGSLTLNNVTVDDTDVEFVSIVVTGGDNPQCTNNNLTDKITINVIENPEASFTSVPAELCDGETATVTFSVNNVGSTDNWEVYYTMEGTQARWSGSGPGTFTRTTSMAVAYTATTTPWSTFETITLDSIVNRSSGTSSGHGPCYSLNLDTDSIEVHAPTIAGTASGTATVCDGANSGTITLSNNVGDVLYWEYSTNNGASWTRINSSAADSVNYNDITVTTQYRAVVLNGTCDEETSNDVTITIQPLPIATITNRKPWTICSGDDVTINFNVTNLVNVSNATWTLNYTVDGVDSTVSGSGDKGSLTLNDVTVDDTDVEFVSIAVTGGDNPQCANTSLTDKITINVIDNPKATLTSVRSDVCTGEKINFTLAVNNVGSADNWTVTYTFQSNTETATGTGPGNFSFVTTNAAVNSGSAPINIAFSLTSIVNNSSGSKTSGSHGSCDSTLNDSRNVQIDPATVGGTAVLASGTSSPVCFGANSGTVEVTGNVGEPVRWQFSTDSMNWTNIAGPVDTQRTFSNLRVTTWYRVEIRSGQCNSEYSSPVRIDIQPLPVATITNSKPWTLCSGDSAIIRFSVSNLVAPVGGADWTLNYTVDGVSGSVNGSGATGQFTVPNVITDDTDVEFVSIVVTGGNNPQCANYNLTDKITIKVIENPKATITSVPNQLCNGDDFSFGINVSNVGSSDNWTVTYTFQTNTETVSGTGPGNFTVNTTASVVNSGNAAINMPVTLTKIVNNTSGGATSGSRGACDSTLNDSKTIQIDPTTVGGTASLGAGTTSPVCEGQNSGTVQVTGQVGEVVRWQYSTDSTNWINMPSTASTTANFNNIAVRTWYRAEVKSGVCDNAFSAPVRIDIQKLPTLTVNTTNVEVCAGVAFNITFNVQNVPSGDSFLVNYNINGTPAIFRGVSTSFANSTHTIASAGLQRTADYTFTGIRITNGTPMCSNTINENTKVTVNDLPNATLVSFSDNICETDEASFTVEVSNVKVNEGWTINYNINGGTTSPTPFTGTGPGVFKFDRSLPSPTGSNNSVTNNVNFELVTNNATNCTNVFDSTAAIKVDKVTDPGSTVAGSATVCEGDNSGTIALSSNNGDVLRWEYSTNGGTTWQNINNTSNNNSYSDLTLTTQYRVLVQNGACDARYSDTATVTVNELPVATISGSTTICEGSTATLTVTVNNTYGNDWEITYLDSNIKRNWTGNGNGTFNFTVGPLNNTRDFTMQSIRLTSGAPQCVNNGLVNNATATITVNPLPNATIVDAPDSICENSSAVFVVNVTNVKTTESWRLQYRLNNVTQTAVTGTGSGTFRVNTPNLSAPTAGIRLASITNTTATPNCTQILTDSITIRVDQQSIGGTLTSAVDTVCKNNGTTLTVSGIRGVVVKWQYSFDNINWSDIANTNTTYNTGNLTRTTSYRVAVKNGACDIAYSNVKTIVVNELPTLTVTPNTTSICSGSTVDLTFSVANSNGQSWRVDYKANGTPQTTPAITGRGSASTRVTFGPLTTTTDYDFVKVYLTSGSTNTRCESVITESATVIVIDNPNATILSATDSICTGSAATVDVNVSDVKTAENWSLIYSIGGVNQAAVTGRGPGNFSFNTPALTTIGNNTIRLVSITNTSSNPNCTSTLTDSYVVRVDDNTIAGTLSTSVSQGCYNDNNGTLTLAGNRGRIVRWEYSEDNGATWTTTSNNGNTLNFLNLTRTTTYRVLVKNGACAAIYSNNITITIIPEPMAVISGAPEVCTGTRAQFLVTVSNVANGEAWTLTYTENGTTRTLSGTGPGTFTLTTGVLNYTSSPSTVTIDLQSITNVTHGCTNSNLSSSAAGRITPRPVVSFTLNNECADTVANFASTSSIPEGSIVAHRWSFGDGQTSGNANATNVYTNAGVYNVKLVATSDNGCKDSTTRSITIFSNPVADFNLNNSCLNVDASFTDASTVNANPGSSTINAYEWTFGNGTGSTVRNPSLRYTNSGTYDVNLMVSTNNGCTDMITKQITIYPVPNANFIASEPCENDAMNFTNATSVDDGTSTYEWDFAGQGTSTDTDPAFTFTGFGNFNVELIATSNFGCKDTFTRTVIVNPLPTADFNVADVCIGQPSNFVNASTVPTGSITEYYWNLGDTTFDGLENPTHTYGNAGTYNATLRVITDKGCEASVTKPVVVNPLPVVVITPNGPTDFCDGDSVTLTVSNGINTGLRSQSWSTGETTVSITATTGGFYRVRITDLNGCENEDSLEVIVYPNPIADAGRDTAIDKGASVQLNGSGGLTYSWTPSTYLDNPNIPNPLASRMEQTTTYTLTVVDVNGCTDEDDVTVTVLDQFNLNIYNLVTPNGDGANDTWWIENIWAYPDAEVVIVNRYGMEVFRTTNYQNNWDGTYNGNELPDGAYYYIITVPGSDKVYKGAINLVRTNQ